MNKMARVRCSETQASIVTNELREGRGTEWTVCRRVHCIQDREVHEVVVGGRMDPHHVLNVGKSGVCMAVCK